MVRSSRLLAIAVLDVDHRMVGIVTVDEIVDVVEEVASRDIQNIGGMEALRHSLSAHLITPDGKEACRLASDSIHRRDVYGNGHGLFGGRDFQSGGPCTVPTSDHQQWRKFGVASNLPGNSGHGAGRCATA